MLTNIRASMLPAYGDCNRRSAAQQYRKEVERAGFTLNELQPSAGAAFGTAGHAGFEHLLRVKLETGTLGSEADALDIAVERFKEEISTGAQWDETTPNVKTAHFQLRRVVSEIAAFAGSVQPQAVELELRADAGDGFDLSGHIDLLETQGVVRDLKLGALSREYQAQLGGYSMLCRSSGQAVKAVAIDWIERAPKTHPQPPVQTKQYSVQTCEKAAWSVVSYIKRDMLQFRKTGDPYAFAANNMSLMCSNKFCSAHGTAFCDLGR